MSLKTWLTPIISQRLLSEERLLKQRAKAEKRRAASGAAHQVHYFHQVDDPYSALACQGLAKLQKCYAIDVKAHIVGPPPDSAAPEREKLIAYSRRDAALLARRYSLYFVDPGVQPDVSRVAWAGRVLVSAAERGVFSDAAGEISRRVWSSVATMTESALGEASVVLAEPDVTRKHLEAAEAFRQRLGHYLGAMFWYGGEWYWGIDRLYHLEQRLQGLGLHRTGSPRLLFPPADDPSEAFSGAHSAPIDFYFSLRSPYSAIVAPRVFALGRLAGVPVRLRFLLPMVMRGLPVPAIKRRYITLDAAREARARGIAFGRLNDPVGRPTERGLALIPLAEQLGKGPAYVLSFMQGVWSEGIDAGSDRGLRTIAQRADIPWNQALKALKDDSWRATAAANRLELMDLGLWGVPSFRIGELSVWGQDRLWAVQETLLRETEGLMPRQPICTE